MCTYLLLQQTLDLRRLAAPKQAEVVARLQCLDPDGNTQSESKDGTGNNQPTLGAKPASVCGQEQCREGNEEGNEDEYRIYDASWRWISPGWIKVQALASRLWQGEEHGRLAGLESYRLMDIGLARGSG
jgi:hypothetical protein